jgi:3-oxoacyl-[acyl-carrier-protein] synthase-3
MNVIISDIEIYLPNKIVTNDELSLKLDTSDEWIRTRTGIVSRHIADTCELTSDLGTKAALKIFEKSRNDVLDIGAIVVATSTADRRFPSCAVKIQNNIGAKNAFAFDVNAACCGFVYALSVAESLILTNKAKKVLLIGADALSQFVDWTDRSTCVLFGDGAGACLLESASDQAFEGIVATKLYSDGSKYELIVANQGPQNDHRGYISMSGKAVFKCAIEHMYTAISEILAENSMTLDDIDWIIPHQANKRIIDSMVSLKGIPAEKIIITVQHHANTSAASIPLALKESLDSGKVRKGQTILVAAFGAGLVWGSAILRM